MKRRPEWPFGASLSGERRFGNFAEVAQSASDAPPPSAQAAGCLMVSASRRRATRVTTAFNRLLRLPGASVIDVSFAAEGVIVMVRSRRRRRVCAGRGQTGRQLEIHDRRVKRWRHRDLGANRCIIECEPRRLRCRDCGVRLEPVPWARLGARHTRDFEDVVAWFAQQMAETPIRGLLQIGRDTVGRIVARVTADRLDERRLDGLVCIGVDEISCRRWQCCLSSVADHPSGAIVWCRAGRNSATLAEFFAELGDRKDAIRAVSIDMSGEYQRALREAIPDAELCFDPFHVCRLARARPTRSAATNGTLTSVRTSPPDAGSKGTRWSLLKAPERRTVGQLATLYEVLHANRAHYHAFLLAGQVARARQAAVTHLRPQGRRRHLRPGGQAPPAAGSRARPRANPRHAHARRVVEAGFRAHAATLAPKTRKQHAWALENHLAELLDLPLTDIDVPVLAAHQRYLLDDGRSANTVPEALTRLSGVLQIAVEHGHIPANAARALRKTPAEPREEVRPLAPVELEALIDAFKNRDRAITVLRGHLGLRPLEIRLVPWGNLRDGTLTAGQARTKRAAARTRVSRSRPRPRSNSNGGGWSPGVPVTTSRSSAR